MKPTNTGFHNYTTKKPAKKKAKLKDVLGKNETTNWIVDKFLHLKARIESKNPSIDDFNLRWVEHKIEDIKNGVILEKDDIAKANKIWKEWK